MPFSNEESRYFDFLRNKFFNNNIFNKEILKSFEIENYELNKENICQNTSFILQKFITKGRNLWSDIKEKVEEQYIEITQNNIEEVLQKFPIIGNKFVDLYNLDKNNIKDIKAFHRKMHIALSNIFSRLCFSNQQFAKNLAGKTFELHIQTLLEVCNYKFERQKHISEGQILDFVYPNINRIQSSPSDCIVSECQSTLKDRFRLSLGKIPPNKPIRKFIFTGSGLNIITSNDSNDITKTKIEEMRDKGWTLVVFDEVKKKFWEDDSVVSYELFFNKIYPSYSNLWS